MVNERKKIGGEYGEVRANIDTEKLNRYFEKHVKAIRTPVDIKQFKVRFTPLVFFRLLTCRDSLGR